MPPLRKSFQRKSAERNSQRRSRTLHISGMAAAVSILLLSAVVAWSFFMGFMVGQGQNPDLQLQEITGVFSGATQQQSSADVFESTPKQETELGNLFPKDDPGLQAATQEQVMADSTGSIPAPPVQTAPEHATTQDPFPFSRPSGESLAAWGIKPDTAPTTATKAVQPSTSKPEQPTPLREKIFDYVFQTAAFKTKEPAERLRQRLNEAGMRTRISKEGKFYLVMVHLRGNEREAANLIEEIRRSGLDEPLRRSKKSVPDRRSR